VAWAGRTATEYAEDQVAGRKWRDNRARWTTTMTSCQRELAGRQAGTRAGRRADPGRAAFVIAAAAGSRALRNAPIIGQ